MSLKYRIVYDTSPRYKNRTILQRCTPYLLPLLLCAVFIYCLLTSSDPTKFHNLLLPGDPAVTIHAFQQLSEEISNGETVSNALGVFCETVLEVR